MDQQATPENWDFVLEELKRVDTLQTKYSIMYGKVADVKQEVQLIKKVQGIDQDIESQADKKEQTIQNKLPAILTQNERRRYQNIGKEFVKGASEQFQNIKKAIKMKEDMSTQQKNFKKNIESTNQKIKDQVKASGRGSFWKKLFGVVAVLGVVAFLFRDKIAKIMPDLSKGTDGIGQKIGVFFAGLLSSLLTYTGGIIGAGFSSIIKYACVNVLPNLLHTFFNETLPISMVMGTLAVMSMFSESAGVQLEQMMGRTPSDVADMGENQLDNETSGMPEIKNSEYTHDAINNVADTDALYARRLLASLGNALYQMNENDGAFRGALDAINQMTNSDFSTLVSQNKIGVTSLIQSMQTVLNNRSLTEQQKREQIAKLLRDSIANAGGPQLDLSDIKVELNSIESLVGLLVNDARYGRLKTIVTNSIVPGATVTGTVTTVQQSVPPVITNINVGDVLAKTFTESVVQILTSLNDFLNGRNNNKTLIGGINKYFQVLGEASKQYLGQTFDLIRDNFMRSFRVFVAEPPDASMFGEEQEETQPSVGETTVNGKGMLLQVNIRVEDQYAAHIATSLADINNTNQSSLNEIKSSNTKLQSVIEALKDKLVVSNVDKASSEPAAGQSVVVLNNPPAGQPAPVTPPALRPTSPATVNGQ